MTSDRELLRLAAKAAGIVFAWINGDGAREDRKPNIVQPYVRWNPLTDDGDAFRLAVTLGRSKTLTLHVGVGGVECLFDHPEVSGFDTGNDPCASARRAIVMAVAEIGRAMP